MSSTFKVVVEEWAGVNRYRYVESVGENFSREAVKTMLALHSKYAQRKGFHGRVVVRYDYSGKEYNSIEI